MLLLAFEPVEGKLSILVHIRPDGALADHRLPDLGKGLLDAVVVKILLPCQHVPRLHLHGVGDLDGPAADGIGLLPAVDGRAVPEGKGLAVLAPDQQAGHLPQERVFSQVGHLPFLGRIFGAAQKVLEQPVAPGFGHLFGILLHLGEISFGSFILLGGSSLLRDRLDRFSGISVKNAQGQVLGQRDGDRIALQVVDLLAVLVQAEVGKHRIPEGFRADAPQLGVPGQECFAFPVFGFVQLQHGLPGVAEEQRTPEGDDLVTARRTGAVPGGPVPLLGDQRLHSLAVPEAAAGEHPGGVGAAINGDREIFGEKFLEGGRIQRRRGLVRRLYGLVVGIVPMLVAADGLVIGILLHVRHHSAQHHERWGRLFGLVQLERGVQEDLFQRRLLAALLPVAGHQVGFAVQLPEAGDGRVFKRSGLFLRSFLRCLCGLCGLRAVHKEPEDLRPDSARVFLRVFRRLGKAFGLLAPGQQLRHSLGDLLRLTVGHILLEQLRPGFCLLEQIQPCPILRLKLPPPKLPYGFRQADRKLFFSSEQLTGRLQLFTVEESIFPNYLDALRDGHAGQARAAREGPAADFRDARRDGDAGQVRAAREGTSPDFRDALRDGHAGQARAALEGPPPDFRDARRDGHTGQTCAVLKNAAFDFRDALRDGYISAGALILFQNALLNDKILISAHTAGSFIGCICPGNTAPKEVLPSYHIRDAKTICNQHS